MNIKNIWNAKSLKQVRGKCRDTLSDFQSKIEDTYITNKARLIKKETKDTIKECQELQERSTQRFESYYKRKQIIDYIVYADLALTNILLIILAYVVFIKK